MKRTPHSLHPMDIGKEKPSHLPTRIKTRARTSQCERGISLVVVLLILFTTSLLGVSATQIALLSQRAARSDRDQQMALQAAEAALSDAEQDIFGSGSANDRSSLFRSIDLTNFVAGCGSNGNSLGLCAMPSSGTKPAWLLANLDAASASNTVPYGQFTGQTFPTVATGVGPIRPPRYVIEALHDPAGDKTHVNYLFRVTAIGFGPRTDIFATLQIVYRL